MKILIIGSNGYIGKNLVKYLSNEGFDVVAGAREKNPKQVADKNITKAYIDLREPETYIKYLNKVDCIVYLAGPGGPLRDQFNSKLIQEHLSLFARFLEKNASALRCPIIFSSSGGTIYGEGNGTPFLENNQLRPVNPYGMLKLLSENLLQYFQQNFGVSYVSMRISNPYGGLGHSKVDQGVINIFIRMALLNKSIQIWGDGSSVRDYIYMPDLMAAFKSAICAKDFSGVVNIGSGVGVSLVSICNAIEMHGLILKKDYQIKNPALVDYSVLNVAKAANFLGWHPVYDVNEGISEIFKSEKLS